MADLPAIEYAQSSPSYGSVVAEDMLSVNSELIGEPLYGKGLGGGNSGDETEVEDEAMLGFGAKTIGVLGSFALVANNITGPGMIQIPNLYQEAGWFFPTLLVLCTFVISSLAATLLCEAMSRIPGNDKYQSRMELTSLSRHLFAHRYHLLTVVLFVLSLQSSNISSIIESAQTVDLALIRMGRTCALQMLPHWEWRCVTDTGDSNSPFGDDAVVISLGFLITLCLSVPLGYWNLDENIWVQVAAFFSLFAILIEWFFVFVIAGLGTNPLPAIGDSQKSVIGTVFFNFAFVTSIPSWVNEKKEKVSITKTVWWANVLSTSVFMFLGFFGGSAFIYENNKTLLDAIDDTDKLSHGFHIFSQICVYAFPIVALVTGIPIFSIIIRYNILENRMCSRRWANFWAVIAPWLISVPFYTGSGLKNVVSWTGVFVNGFVNFVIPLLLYLKAHEWALIYSAEDDGVVEFHTEDSPFITDNGQLGLPAPDDYVEGSGHFLEGAVISGEGKINSSSYEDGSGGVASETEISSTPEADLSTGLLSDDGKDQVIVMDGAVRMSNANEASDLIPGSPEWVAYRLATDGIQEASFKALPPKYEKYAVKLSWTLVWTTLVLIVTTISLDIAYLARGDNLVD